MSAHADYSESMRWLSGFTRAPAMTYLVHGDPVALAALAARITAEKRGRCTSPHTRSASETDQRDVD